MVAVEFRQDLRDASHTLEAALRRAKFAVPTLPRRFLSREKPLRTLNALLESDQSSTRVVTISAPVGYGKSSLVASVARGRAAGDVAWCTLDAEDNDAHEFGLSILEAVLAARSSAAIGRAADAGRAASNPLDEAMLAAYHGEPLLLVLDECEHIRPAAAHATIQRLVRQAPANMSIVLVASREIGITERSTAHVATMRAADLAFTADDLAALTHQERLAVDADTLETFATWIDGSPSASTLLCSVFKDARDRDSIVAAALRADCSPHVVLFERLLQRLPDDQHEVLLASSVVEHVSAELTRAITVKDGAEESLKELVRGDVFFDVIPGCPGWYRHRHPSRELLAAELRHARPGDVAALHTNAARWFLGAAHGRRALTSAIFGDDDNLVCALVLQRWVSATLNEVSASFDALLPRIAEMVDNGTSKGALASVAVALDAGDVDTAAAKLDALSSSPSQLRSVESRFHEALLRLRLARDRCDATGIQEACDFLLDESMLKRVRGVSHDDVRALAQRALAEARLIRGDLHGATDMLEFAYTEASVNGRDRHVTEATAMLALTTAMTGRVRRASALVDELGNAWFPGLELARGVHATARAICEYHADDVAAAQTAASEARRRLRAGVYRDVALAMVRARISECTGDHATAQRLQARVADAGHDVLYETLRDALGFTEISVAFATNAESAGRLATGHPYRSARAHLVAAVAAYDAEMYAEAWEYLERTLSLSERNSYRRVFVDSGLPVRDLLRDYIAQARPFSPVAWQLLVRLPADRAQAPCSVEALTERELAVLRLLPSMKSNHEIAAEMFFSVNTVKTHLKSIYRKLGVSRRRAAVEEARARSLL